MTPLKIIKSIYLQDEIKIKNDVVKIRLFNTLMTFSFLFLFVFIKKVPLELLFFLEGFFTNKSVMQLLVISAFVTLSYGVFEKNWGYSISIIIVLIAQILFLNFFADRYSLDEKAEILKENHKPHIHYSKTWNMG